MSLLPQPSASLSRGAIRLRSLPRMASVLGLVALTVWAAAPAALAQGGDKLWVSRYDGPGHDFDQAQAIAVSPVNGDVFITGMRDNTTTADMATVA